MQIEFPKQDCDMNFLKKNRVILYMVGFFICVVSIFFLGNGYKNYSLNDYFYLNSYRSLLEKGEDVDREKLNILVKANPKSRPYFDHFVMRSNILNGDVSGALTISDGLLNRLKFIDFKYIEYAHTTDLIEKSNYQEALDMAISLRDKMLTDGNSSLLYYFNLIRIVFLQKMINGQCDNLLIDELRSLDRDELAAHFSDEQLSIIDFLTY